MMGRAAYQEPWRLLAVDPLRVRRARIVRLAQGGGACAHPLYRARVRARHAVLCDRAAHPRPLPRGAGARARSAATSRPKGSSPAPGRMLWRRRSRWWPTWSPTRRARRRRSGPSHRDLLELHRKRRACRRAPVAVISIVSANTQPVLPSCHFGSNRSMLKANTMPGWNSSPITFTRLAVGARCAWWR